MSHDLTTDNRNTSEMLDCYVSEIQALRNRVRELERENERLRKDPDAHLGARETI